MINELKLKELSSDSKNVNVRVKVLEKNTERNVTVKKDNTKHRVANFIISDETSTFFLTVWDDDIDNIPIKETPIIIKNTPSPIISKGIILRRYTDRCR